ncbi:MAG: heavy metal-binding domain-containing protein [Gammaproteobacteria bacterium]
MSAITGLTGNDLFCLAQKNYQAGNMVIGNSLHSLGLRGTIGSELKGVLGKELKDITQLLKDGRQAAYDRMLMSAKSQENANVIGIKSDLILHNGHVEFLTSGSLVTDETQRNSSFTTSADGRELFALLDAGYTAYNFVFGNVAYSTGMTGGLIGRFKAFARGEVDKLSVIFNQTRHLAIERMLHQTKNTKANAIIGVTISTLPFSNVSEILCVGTAAHHPKLSSNEIASSHLPANEVWSLAKIGYAPSRIVLGSTVYSLGLIGSVASTFKSMLSPDNELTKMINEARNKTLTMINNEAKAINAEKIIGIRTHTFNLGSGLIEFLTIGTAIRKVSDLKTESNQLPIQAL